MRRFGALRVGHHELLWRQKATAALALLERLRETAEYQGVILSRAEGTEKSILEVLGVEKGLGQLLLQGRATVPRKGQGKERRRGESGGREGEGEEGEVKGEGEEEGEARTSDARSSDPASCSDLRSRSRAAELALLNTLAAVEAATTVSRKRLFSEVAGEESGAP